MWEILQADVLYIISSCGHHLKILSPHFSLHLWACVMWPYFLLRSRQRSWSSLLPILPPPPHVLLYLLRILSSTSSCPVIPYPVLQIKSCDSLSVCLYISKSVWYLQICLHHTCTLSLFFSHGLLLSPYSGYSVALLRLLRAAQTITHDRT